MVGISALWMPIVVSAVFVFIALLILHMMPGWHKGDMAAVPGEARVMETLRALNVQPGDYRFPFSNSIDEMKTSRSGPGTRSTWESTCKIGVEPRLHGQIRKASRHRGLLSGLSVTQQAIPLPRVPHRSWSTIESQILTRWSRS